MRSIVPSLMNLFAANPTVEELVRLVKVFFLEVDDWLGQAPARRRWLRSVAG